MRKRKVAASKKMRLTLIKNPSRKCMQWLLSLDVSDKEEQKRRIWLSNVCVCVCVCVCERERDRKRQIERER